MVQTQEEPKTARATDLLGKSVGFPSLLAQSIAQIAPIGAALGTLLGAAAYANGAFPLAVLVAMVVTAFWINIPYQFSKKIVGAGGFYHYATQAVGPMYGSMNAWLYLLSYFAFIAPGGLLVFGGILPAVFSLFGVNSYPSTLWIPMNVVFTVAAGALAYSGIRPSLKYSLIASLLEVGFLLILSFVIIGSPSVSNTASVFSPSLAPNGWNGVFLGAVFGFSAVAGVSGTVYLGDEAKAPIKNIRRALLISYLVTALTFLTFSYAMTVGWGIPNMPNFAASGIPGVILAQTFLGPVGLIVIGVLGVNSVFAVTLAGINSSSRLMYSMGKDGVIAPAFGKVNTKRKTPATAIWILTIVSIAISTVVGLWLGPVNGFVFIMLLIGVPGVVGHVMGSIALPMYFRKIKQLNPIFHVLVPALYIISAIGIAYSLLVPLVYPVYIAPIIVLAWVVIGIIIFQRAKRRLPNWSLVGRPLMMEERAPVKTTGPGTTSGPSFVASTEQNTKPT